MAFTPGYGETPVPDDDLDYLLPEVREALGESVSKAAITTSSKTCKHPSP